MTADEPAPQARVAAQTRLRVLVAMLLAEQRRDADKPGGGRTAQADTAG